jgi:FkbM family methyltransferase
MRRARRDPQGRARRSFRRYCARVPWIAADPTFVKIGAYDGVTDDPCAVILLADRRWKGLLVEPVPHCFDRLRANFPDADRFSLERVAIGPRPGTAAFYYVDPGARRRLPDLPPWIDQLGSFDRDHVLKHLDGVLAPFVVECRVEVRRLDDLLSEHGIGDVHLLHVDAEGHDYEVLKTLNLSERPPVAIFVEHGHLPDGERRAMVDLLREAGYSVRDCGKDYFAIHGKARRRLRRGSARSGSVATDGLG